MSMISAPSVYVILINSDNKMITSQKQRIVQRSKLVDDLWFLVEPEYNGYNMSEFTVVLEYLSPISRKYRTEFLILNEEMYGDYLKYTLPFDTKLTAEAGEIELQLTFIRSELNENGKGVQRVRKVTGTNINVIPISAWSDIIPDCALTALDQRIIKMDAQIKALNETSAVINDKKADNIFYNETKNELQLMSGTTPIGNKVVLSNVGIDEDGMPVVDFTSGVNKPDSDNPGNTEDDNSNDVVEF